MSDDWRSEVDDPGDVQAEPGSKAWALGVRGQLRNLLHDAKADAQALADWMNLMDRHQGYRQLHGRDGRPFRSFEAFCIAPSPFGLGYEKRAIDRIVTERREMSVKERAEQLPAASSEHVGRGHRTKDLIPMYGEDSNYLTRRLLRDHPEIAARMKDGEFRSVNAAALEAGIIPRRVKVRVDDPDSVARTLRRHMKPADLQRLREALGRA